MMDIDISVDGEQIRQLHCERLDETETYDDEFGTFDLTCYELTYENREADESHTAKVWHCREEGPMALASTAIHTAVAQFGLDEIEDPEMKTHVTDDPDPTGGD